MYAPPLADFRFLLTHLAKLDQLPSGDGCEPATGELAEAVLEEAGRLSREAFAPLNRVGDTEGARFADGRVTMPKGFREAWKSWVEGGWNALPVPTTQGGQGLPWSVALAAQEIWQSGNLALALCGLLNQGAIELLAEHGDDALKARFLPNLVSGAWSGTMNITEPQAGSDVGAIRCKAAPNGDHYLVTGQKIFISYGDHDLSVNILHLVLARLPDAPEGTRGLSLFLVPKILVNDDGVLGAANDVRVVSIEHKLGQHASPTCVMSFGDSGGAKGWLVGKAHGGIAAMFTMMNNARIGVGIQGLGLMERAYQEARDYATTRVQGRSLEDPKGPLVPILKHPDVRRNLLLMRSITEAGRALVCLAGAALDQSRRAPDPAARQAAQTRVELLTPIIKGWLTDRANEVTSIGVQVCGGMGFIEETGVAQHMRDARVLAIYEGTNGIQAQDLVFRKLARDNGAGVGLLMAEMMQLVPELEKLPADDLNGVRPAYAAALNALQTASTWIRIKAGSAPALAAASATPFLTLTGNVVAGYALVLAALRATEAAKAGGLDPGFAAAKRGLALFYAAQILPGSLGLAVTITEGPAPTLAFGWE